MGINYKKILSKSKVMTGLQCEKALWFSVHKPKLAAPVTPQQQALFDGGHEAGAEAVKRFPGGVMIEAEYWDFQGAVEQTKKALEDGFKDIYEASFIYDNVFARVDILHFEDGAWDLIEVKSTTKVKDEHIFDVAVQRYILENVGIKIRSCQLMHINNQCVAPHLDDLFVLEDISEAVAEISQQVIDEIPLMKEMLLGSNPPDIDIGPQCTSPYECKFKEHCWKNANLPSPGVFDLPGLGKKAWDHYNEGRLSMQDMQGQKLSAVQCRAMESSVAGELICNGSEVQKMLKGWQFPLYHLDFETIAYVVPFIEGTRPYEQLPFQYSLHVQSEACGDVEHFEFLNTADADPRRALAEALVGHIGDLGSVVAYNKSFEARVLRGLAEAFPDLKDSLLDIESRLVDPLPVFQACVYHPDFLGSFSIKAVAPALIGDKVDYKSLEVSDGALAQVAYRKMMDLPVGNEGREKLTSDLLEYCKLDTLSMVYLVDWLYESIVLNP